MSIDTRNLVGKLNPLCKRVFELAAEGCVSNTNFTVELEHLLSKLQEMPDSDFAFILRYYEIELDKFSQQLDMALSKLKRGNTRTPALSQHILTLLQDAWLITTLTFNEQRVRSGSLLLALINSENLRGILMDSCPILYNIPAVRLQEDIQELIEESSEGTPETVSQEPGANLNRPVIAREALDQYTIDLIQQAHLGKIDPIEGRDKEIRQVIDVLTRRRQNNPILVGEAGVGKTAIVEGLALRLVKGDVPESLKDVSIRTLDLGLLEAGAGIKGEFENRLKSVISEVNASPTPIILFIDEAHTLIGSGDAPGQSDAANLLKPALARGELRTIAATTWSEYKKYFEKDAALSRRFQLIKVDEPDEKTGILMVRSLVKKMEEHHQVRILDEAIRAAVSLSQKYITGRQLPDKAVSVLDTACARVALAQTSTPETLEALRREEENLQSEITLLERESSLGAEHKERLNDLNQRCAHVVELQSQKEKQWHQELSLVKEILALQEKIGSKKSESVDLQALEQLESELHDLRDELPLVPVCVDRNAIASVIAGWTGIPVGKMLQNEMDTILTLKDRMEERLVGQPYALETIAKRVQTYYANLDESHKPVGTFLLVGPSGVGKTETALTLADILYGGERNLITLNMSEYQEPYTVSSLKGSPPGYIGFGQGGTLTEAVRRNPYSVVLLDEIEKAHPDVMELFYQVFDKGVMEDGEGIEIDFKNTLIILTSNLGSEEIFSSVKSGEVPSSESLMACVRPELLKHFKPAFLGRLVVVPYVPLGDDQIQKIVTLKLNRLQNRFQESHSASLTYDENVILAIASRCTEVESGARNIDFILTHNVLPALSAKILDRLAKDKKFAHVHISLSEEGEFGYTFLETLPEKTLKNQG
ncbi:MAG: type VI secretion system ATPase TssH [Alphaproteobacteria bacterium]|nr:type VI secretion system ATPase TssH [Alphaproteobacteria bacterium]MBT5390655.1 type VI secretion system ATPase TssH [Alphaproteobacteria bacterium]MBT5654073.1 type VI secretion system ATPase TssH [Alphaproteobacteria bacterium]